MKQQPTVNRNTIQKSKTVGLLFGLVLSLSAFSQTNTTQTKTFIFSKYQLSAQGGATTTSFFNVPLKSSPYKIHYKIKTLTFPADTEPERPLSFTKALINGIVESATKKLFKDDCEEQNRLFVPLKPTSTYKY